VDWFDHSVRNSEIYPGRSEGLAILDMPQSGEPLYSASSYSTPDFSCHCDHQTELRDLILDRDLVAENHTGKPALGA
jgi:hypothetical protein